MRLSPFFDGIEQADVETRGFVAPTPTFYPDAGLMEATFPARLSGLRRLLPDPRFVPLRVAPGVGAVTIDCFEYRECDLGPYREVGISVLLVEPTFGSNVPGRQFVSLLRRRQGHGFVVHLPVTTEIALAVGVDLYAFPKFLADIAFQDTPRTRSCRLAEGQAHILTLTGERIATPNRRVWQSFAHLWMNGQPQRGEVRMNQLQQGMSCRLGVARIELGDAHPIARELSDVLLSRQSIVYNLVPRQEAILYGPDHLTVPLLRRVLAAGHSAPGAAVQGAEANG
jgi:hypothetical protein